MACIFSDSSAAFLTKAARFSRLFRPWSSLNCMRCGREACSTTTCDGAEPTFAARAAGFAQQGAPSNTEQHSCLNPVTAVGCACFADICMSEHRGRACMSHAVLYSCYIRVKTRVCAPQSCVLSRGAQLCTHERRSRTHELNKLLTTSTLQ